MKLSLVILNLNELEGLREVFEKIPRNTVDEILCVDGGSTDGSLAFLEAKGVPIVQQSSKGRGEAFRIAFEATKGDAIIFFSPDGNEDPADIPKFRQLLDKGFDMVIANRMSQSGVNEEDTKLLKWRKWANQTFTLMANITWNGPAWLADSINGFRAITRNAWRELAPDGTGYTIEYQCSIRARKKKMKVAEFPTHEFPRVDASRGSPSIATGMAFLKLYFREVSLGRFSPPAQPKRTATTQKDEDAPRTGTSG